MNKRWLALGVLPVCLALLAGCGGGGGTGAGNGAIVFQVSGDQPELVPYPKLVAAYERKTGARVKLVEVDKGTNFQKLTTAFAAGTPPDVFLASYGDFGGFAAKSVLDPVGPRLDASKALKRSGYYRQALAAFTTGGELQCMPQDASTPVVFYNRDAFRRAGLADPSPSWTFADFRTAAQKLRGVFAGQSNHFAVGFEPDMERLASFVFAAGGNAVDNQAKPTGFTLDSPASKRGLQAFFGLSRLAPNESVLKSVEPDELFSQGQIAMFVDSRKEVTKLRAVKGFDWDVAPFPRLATAASALHSDGYCIAKGDRAAAAWRFIEFATGPEGQRLLTKTGGILPALKKVATSKLFLAPAQKPRSSNVFLDAIAGARPLPNSANWAQVEAASHPVIEESFFEAAKAPGLPEIADEFIRRLISETSSKF